MVSIEQVIQRSPNPFDPVTFRTGNFWQEDDHTVIETVQSIHQGAIAKVQQIVQQVAQDHKTRSILLMGDVGSGKSYVLGRLKQTLNDQAFFAYIGPCPDSDYMWRHTLRQTVDSLMYHPEGQTQSQLLLWLNNLAAFQDKSFMKKLLGERQLFIQNFRSSHPTGIFQAKDFFSVLYALTQPESYPIACDWLRGEDLDTDDLKQLGVKTSIDSESAARNILSNFGRISTSAYPIVLCFDQVESKQLPDGSTDLQPTLNVNTTLHNERIKNFVVIISIVVHTWKEIQHRIQKSDRDRLTGAVTLRPITLDQAEALWKTRLLPLHYQANPRPQDPIFPLSRQALENRWPGGKTTPRNALALGHQLFVEYKSGHVPPPPPVETKPVETKVEEAEEEQSLEDGSSQAAPASEEESLVAFRLLWQSELAKTQRKVFRVRQFSSLELTAMLKRAILVLKGDILQSRLLPSTTYGACSFRYDQNRHTTIGIAWLEEPNMTSFFRIMEACQKAIAINLCHKLYFVRAENVGKPTNKGNKLYREIFHQSDHRHIVPDLDSVILLATYDRLVNSARAGELVIHHQMLTPIQLEQLMRDAQVLDHCRLLQELHIVHHSRMKPDETVEPQAREFILNFVQRESLIAIQSVLQNAQEMFPKLDEPTMKKLIQKLCKEKHIQILDPNAPFHDQVICWIPSDAS